MNQRMKQLEYLARRLSLLAGVLACVLAPAAGQTMITAGDLLEKSRQAEEQALAQSVTPVWARSFTLEERPLGGPLTTRFRIEVRRSKASGASAMRLYDADETLLAGAWRLNDGSLRNYPDAPPARPGGPENHTPPALNRDTIWFFGASVQPLAALLKQAQQTVVQESSASYTVDMRVTPSPQTQGLIRARLVLRRADLWPVQQTLMVENAGEIVEYKLTETEAGNHTPGRLPAEVAQLDEQVFPAPSGEPVVIAVKLPAATPGSVLKDQPGAARPKVPQPTPTPAPPIPAPTQTPSSPASDPSKLPIVSVGPLVSIATHQKPPAYPQTAKILRISGSVKVVLELDETGAIARVVRIEGHPVLQKAVEEALPAWHFKPTRINGQARRVSGFIVFSFAAVDRM